MALYRRTQSLVFVSIVVHFYENGCGFIIMVLHSNSVKLFEIHKFILYVLLELNYQLDTRVFTSMYIYCNNIFHCLCI